MKHGLFHLIGCLVPIALIFILPALGVRSEIAYALFIVLMFACHLFMMGGSKGARHAEHEARSGTDVNASGRKP